MSVRGIGHANLRASAETVERLRRFYVDVIGLCEGARPAFRSGSHGYWLYAGDSAVLHLAIARSGAADGQPAGTFTTSRSIATISTPPARAWNRPASATKPISWTNCIKRSCS